MTHVWCFAPAAWGLWAMLAPSAWVPRRLPAWGSILGVIAGLLATFVLDMPGRILGVSVPFALRFVPVAVLAVFYFFLWLLVRAAYRSFEGPASAA